MINNSLARGYATQTIRKYPDISIITDCYFSQKMERAQLAFGESSWSKKPGRTLHRIKKHIGTAFPNLQIDIWSKILKCVSGSRYVSSYDADIFNIQNEDAFLERSIMLSSIAFVRLENFEHIRCSIEFSSHISHHAIQRMIQRGASTPEEIEKDILNILEEIQYIYFAIKSHPDPKIFKTQREKSYNLLIPYRDGALVLRTMNFKPSKLTDKVSPLPTLSIRSYLDPSKLSHHDHQRMKGYPIELIKRTSLSDEKTLQEIAPWFLNNFQEHIIHSSDI